MIATNNGLVDYPDDDLAIMNDTDVEPAHGTAARAGLLAVEARTPALAKTRLLSDGGSTPSKLTASPCFIVSSRQTSKDDSNLIDFPAPVTPRSSSLKPLPLHMPCCQLTPPSAASNSHVRPPPLSPKLDHAPVYTLPTNILPRRSRGLDFSRAATSLHHSTLAEQSSPDSSPTMADRAMNIPGLRGQYGGPEQTSTSLWSMMGSHDKANANSSLGSVHAVGSDSSSSSDDDHLMDEDTDEPCPMTPQAKSFSSVNQRTVGGPLGSPAMGSLTSFQQRQRPRKHLHKKIRGPLGLGFNIFAASLSKSPPSGAARARRESISWQAKQLHISGIETEDGARSQSDVDAGSGEGQRKVIRRAVTRRGSLLPKTKTFARIRAALAEEGAPADAETRREAEVVKQVRESDMGLELHAAASTLSSPNLTTQESADDIAEDIMGDLASTITRRFKQHAMRNSKGKPFWDAFSESSSWGGTHITPPPTAVLPRGSSSGMSEDTTMDSPSLAGPPGHLGSQSGSASGPSATELTRRIRSKRWRDDDLDPLSFKRRAVSPGMSVHNSPILQSPMQRDSSLWGSRPDSTGAEKAGSSAPSEMGSLAGTPSSAVLPSVALGRFNAKGRVSFQGMVDTNDGIMRMSIE